MLASGFNARALAACSSTMSLSAPGSLRQCRRWLASSPRKRPRTALFFPGQGVQRVGMTAPWLEAFPRIVKPILEEIDHTLNYPLTRIIADGTNAALTATENSQPAIMATSILILRVLEQHFGFRTEDRVDVTLGHSLGEFAALVAAGYLRFDDSLRLVRLRGEAMADCSREASRRGWGDVGMIALVCCDENSMQSLKDTIYQFIDSAGAWSKQDVSDNVAAVERVSVANINSKNQIVLSGSISEMYTLLTHVRQFGGHDPRHVRLNADSPFHSPIMKPAEELMRRLLYRPSPATGGDVVTWPGALPCISNVTALPFKSRDQLKDLLARQCSETVRWWYSIRYLDQEERVRRWVGIGPGKVGRNLVGKEVGMKGAVKGGGVWAITSPREIEEVLRGLEDTEGANED